jgi:type VI secretion system protein ImpJ
VIDPGVKDESIGNDSEPIDVARLLPCVSLFAGSVPPVDSDYCPLLEVALDANNQYQLGDYHPPLVCLGACDFLGDASLQSRLSDLKLQMWEKLRDLVRETGSESDNAQVSSDPATQQLLTIARHVAMSLPNLSIMADSPQTRPVTMYTILAQVVGQMAPIGSSPMLPALNAYDHEDCFDGFDVVISYISRKLAQINLRYETLSFARVGQGSFGRRLPADVQQDLVIELKPRDGESAQAVSHWLHHSVICAIDLLPVLQERRLPGAHRKQLDDEAIAALGLRRGGLFFLLRNRRYDVGGVMQDTIQANQTLLIRGHGQASLAPFEIILHRPRPDPAATNTSIPIVMDEVSNAF